MLHAEVAEEPRTEHDERLENDILVYFPATFGYVDHGTIEHVSSARENDEGQEDTRREEGVEKEHRNDGIVTQRLLLAHIIKSQQRGRKEC